MLKSNFLIWMYKIRAQIAIYANPSDSQDLSLPETRCLSQLTDCFNPDLSSLHVYMTHVISLKKPLRNLFEFMLIFANSLEIKNERIC